MGKKAQTQIVLMFYFVDSCLVVHVWNNFKVGFLARYILKVVLDEFCVLITLRIFHSYYETKAVFLAMGITAVVCIAVTIFCFQTKVDGDVNCASRQLSSLWLVR